MDRLRQLISQISAQMSVLTLSQRLAIGLCVALVAVSLMWMLQWSTTPELTPLAMRDFSFEELQTAEDALRKEGINYDIQGTRLFVKSADQRNAVRVVFDAGALPEGSLFDMATVVNDKNPFQSPEARAYAQNYATGNELAKILVTSPAVKQASVMVNPQTKRRLGGGHDVPTASVTVTLASGRDMSPSMVEGFAKLVAGAVGGLKPHNVFITDARTLRSYGIPHPDNAVSFDLLGMIKQREDHYRNKILDKLSDIPGVQVAVTVDLDMSKRVTQNIKHDLPQPRIEKSNATEQTSSSTPAEPGVQANLGLAQIAAGSGPSNTSEETTVENFPPERSQTETIEHMPFATKAITAAVGIPRSFVVGVFKAKFPGNSEMPSDADADFITVRDEQVARVLASVQRIIMAKSPDDVEVDVYPDMDWTADGGMWRGAPGELGVASHGEESFNALGVVQTYGPQAGLAVLALTSLFMMMRVARKSADAMPARRRNLDSGVPSEDEPLLTVGPAAVGQAEVSEGLLSGKEVDSDTLRYQELSQEVSKMVEQDPAGTADLLRRWIEDT